MPTAQKRRKYANRNYPSQTLPFTQKVFGAVGAGLARDTLLPCTGRVGNLYTNVMNIAGKARSSSRWNPGKWAVA